MVEGDRGAGDRGAGDRGAGESVNTGRAAPTHGIDALPPAEIAHRAEEVGVRKARGDLLSTFLLAVLAGAFITLGAMLCFVVMAESGLGAGPTRLLGGLSFSLGLVLVVLAGAELFTGNNLIAMAWASGRIGGVELVRSWIVVYLGNVIGCGVTAVLLKLAGAASIAPGVAEGVLSAARAKSSLPWVEALSRGVLCNALVCLAIWIALGARSATDKVIAVAIPVAAFVALGFEHVIANWGIFALARLIDPQAIETGPAMTALAAVTVGNVIGGTLLVGAVYWLIYLRPQRRGAR
jgi:formate transporter